MKPRYLRLGINIDHVATLRNARGGRLPDPVRAALLAIEAGADGITAHLREDRRHIVDRDIERLMDEIDKPLNMEMAATDEMLAIALRHKPHAVCLVPERRQEITTEGGLDAMGGHNRLAPYVAKLVDSGIRASLFIGPERRQLDAARKLRAPVVELHTGTYCHAFHDDAEVARRALERLREAAAHAEAIGLECHAGHGLDYDSVVSVAAIPTVVELNIGHFLMGEAVFVGLQETIRKMRAAMDKGRRPGAVPA